MAAQWRADVSIIFDKEDGVEPDETIDALLSDLAAAGVIAGHIIHGISSHDPNEWRS